MIQRENPAADRRPHRHPDGPVRTCVGCRRRELAIGLLRVVAASAGRSTPSLHVDSGGTLPGRGAWLHPTTECAREAVRRRAFARALRITGSPDSTAVIEHTESLRRSSTPATEQVAKNMSTP